MADKTLLDLVIENPHGLGEAPPEPQQPKVFFDEQGQPYDEQGRRIKVEAPADPTLGESLLNIAESPAKMLVGAVSEPISALQRLAENSVDENGGIAIPNPENPQNQQDVLTGLLSLYGGNALNPGRLMEGAAAKAATQDAQMARSLTAAYPGETAAMSHLPPDMWQSVAETNVNPSLTGSGFNRALAASSGYDFGAANVAGKVPLDAYERAALDQEWRNKVRTTGELFSDTGKPSLMGSAIAGAEGNTQIQGFRGSNQARPVDAPRSRYWASTSPEVASGYATSPYGFDAPNVTPVNFNFENPMTVDAGGSYWAQIPHNGGTTTTDNLARLAEANGHDGLIVRNVLDEMAGEGLPADSILALKRGTVTSPLTGETLFSDTGKPSLFGSAVAGAEGNAPIRAYRGKPDAEQLFPEPQSPANRRLLMQTGNPEMVWGSSSPDVAGTYAGAFDNGFGVSSDDLTTPFVGAMAPMDLSFENPMRVDAQGRSWNNIPNPSGGAVPVTTDTLANIALQRGHDGLVVENVLDRAGGKIGEPATTYAALKRGTVTSPLTGETLFSDTGQPSLVGAAVAGEKAPPISAFHATNADFNRFDPAFTDEVGFHFGNKDQAQTRQMVKGGITSFINPWSDWRTIPVNIETQNPASLSRDVQRFTGERVANQLVRDGIAPPSLLEDIAGASPEQQTKYVRDWLVSNGYDAVKYPNNFEGGGAPSYMALGTGNVRHAKTGEVLYAGTPFVPTQDGQEQPSSLVDIGLLAQSDQRPGNYLKKRMDQPYQPAPGEDFQYTPITPEIEQKLREFREPLMDRLMQQNPKMPRWEARQKVNEMQEYKDYKNSIVKPQPFNPQP
jgi:hypothetical protein